MPSADQRYPWLKLSLQAPKNFHSIHERCVCCITERSCSEHLASRTNRQKKDEICFFCVERRKYLLSLCKQELHPIYVILKQPVSFFNNFTSAIIVFRAIAGEVVQFLGCQSASTYLEIALVVLILPSTLDLANFVDLVPI